MIQDDIRNFAKQFAFQPKIENKDRLKEHRRFIVLGMGGSHLAADLLERWDPNLDIMVHSNYGLPELPKRVLRDSLIIASSYSGNTEETLDGCRKALQEKLSVGVIATGGKLLRLAKQKKLPYIELPKSGMQPRSATGLSFMALLAMVGARGALAEASKLAHTLRSSALDGTGRSLAKKLRGRIPVIYTSSKNQFLGYRWKIAFNETGKIPAFANVFPELNHNEMTGFDVKPPTRKLTNPFYFIFLKDVKDDLRVGQRMQLLARMYRDRGLPVEVILMKQSPLLRRLFASVVLADWTAYHTAKQYNLDPDAVPMVEDFKKRLG